MQLRRWRFEEDVLLNFRDMGGYVCDGGSTAYGRFFRSDQPSGLKKDDIRRLKEKGLAHVIDLRSPREKEAFPNDFMADDQVTYHEWYMPIGSKDLAAMGPEVTCQGYNYARRLEASGDYYPRLLTFMSGLEGGVMFHCTAGKDRTGILAGLIHMLLGTEDSDIIAEYQVSETYLEPRYKFFKDFYPTITDWELASEARSMRIMIDWLKENYGGAEAFLRGRGMLDTAVRLLKDSILIP